jgi:hypothetical protein
MELVRDTGIEPVNALGAVRFFAAVFVCQHIAGSFLYIHVASRDRHQAPARRTPTPRSRVARMRKRRTPTGVGQERLPRVEARTIGRAMTKTADPKDGHVASK